MRIYAVVLPPAQRAPKLPEETSRVPLEMWVKGALMEDHAAIGDEVTAKTVTGRVVKGRLDAVTPSYRHAFGTFVAELHDIGMELRQLMEGDAPHDR